jgi:hypothetical protein
MKASEKTDAISPAFVAAQEQLRNPKPDAKGQVRGRQDYVYLSLPALLEYVRKEFGRKGLAVSQDVSGDSTGIFVKTVILHLSGQWFELGPAFIPATGGPQEWGSAITYARRYSLAAAVGLAADEDDDAARVSKTNRAKSVSPAVGDEAVSGSGPRSLNPSEQGRSSGEDSTTLPSTEGASSEMREGEEPRDTEAVPAAKTPGVESPSRRPRCLHLNGTRTVERAGGGRVEVCMECGVVIETVMMP